MEWIKKNIFLVIIFVILIVGSILILNFNNREGSWYYKEGEDISLKHYEENEYIPVNISYDQIARIYLQDYVYKLLYNKEEAYNLLDENYRKEKFTSFEKFSEYADSLNSLKFREMTVKKFAITDKGLYRDYDIYDSADNLFIFREKGVMQYTVYFDRNTVKM